MRSASIVSAWVYRILLRLCRPLSADGRHLQQSEALYRTSRAYGFRGINMDLIYGLPKQTVADFAQHN